MRLSAWIMGAGCALASTGVAEARQHWAPNAFAEGGAAEAVSAPSLTAQSAFRAAAPEAAFGGAIEIPSEFTRDAAPLAAADRRDVWIARGAATDRLTLETAGELRRPDGAPLPVAPGEAGVLEPEAYDLRYVRGFSAARGRTASGLEVSLTPHAGLGVGSEGGSAEAGATLRIGRGLERLAPDGAERFGERPRWYLYAAGSGRAVGYNFARNRDGAFARSGYSHDEGAFLGDASVGVAYRKGPVQTSFGLAYREISANGFRGVDGIDTDLDEGVVAFSLSIKP